MKIIWICPEMIYPDNSGARIVMYNRIKYFSKQNHDIYLVCTVDSQDAFGCMENLSVICKKVILINRNINKIGNIFRSILRPYCIASRTNKKIEKSIYNIVNSEKIDIIFCEFPQMARNISKRIKNKGIKCILSQHNIEFLSMNSLSQCYSEYIRRIIFKFDSFRLKKYEYNLYKSNLFDGYVFLSENDKKYFAENLNVNNKRLYLSPIGSHIHCDKINISQEFNIVIIGKMSYRPNIEGVMWFCNKVFKRIYNQIDKVKLYIVGKEPDKDIKSLASHNIIVTGEVSVIDQYYYLADIVVIPIFYGGGVKTKLIEAASHSKPIIATSFAVKGTIFENEEDLIIEDNSNEFAKRCIDILRHKENYIEMTARCNLKFKENYTWNTIGNNLKIACEEISRLE